ncbi:MAG: hypothetical protein BRC46_11750, partial [Cyanobacteria bacterium QS_6_48_18]
GKIFCNGSLMPIDGFWKWSDAKINNPDFGWCRNDGWSRGPWAGCTLCRRLSKDYELLPQSEEAFIYIAMR